MRQLPALILSIVCLALVPSSSHAFLDFFKKDLDKVPESEEMRQLEAEANVKVTKALELETAGRTSKALDIYKDVVRKYPVTTSAAMSQYKIGAIQKSQGHWDKAFKSFQTFIDEYKQSSAFDAAVASQFEIAEASQSGEYKEKFVGISRKVQRSEVLEMYEAVISNAPYSEYAPQAQFAIGAVREENGDGPAAVLAYKKVVASYPKTALAAEAQFRIGEIGAKAIEDGSRNIANVDSSRRAYEDLLIGYDDHERRDEAESRVVEFNELEAQKAFEVGRFYEKQKQYKSAALYYRRISQSTGTSAAIEAQERLTIVEAKLADELASVSESRSAAAEPTAAVGEETARKSKSLFGGRLFGRKKRAREEAAQIEPPSPSEAVAATPPPAPRPAPAPAATTSRPPVSSPSSRNVAAVAPGATKVSKRKGYYGPPKPDLALSKKQNRMRIDTSKLQGAPFDIGKLDQKDLEKGLKMIQEELPEDLPSGVANLEIPDDIEDKLKGLDEVKDLDEVKKAVEEAGDGEGALKIPPLPEDDEE
ncbi:MAG: tetratricopeptide repeat protein [Verrucomicrobiales bacterium]